MALRKESWLDLAKRLEPGSRRYHDHIDCGPGRTLVVSSNEHGWTAHCFRCNDDGFEPFGTRTLSELRNVAFGLAQQERMFEHSKCSLPSDFTTEIPDYAALWLYKAGIFKSTAKDYTFGWSAKLQRVVLPVYNNGVLDFIQARSIDGRKPKYLNNAAVPKTSILFRSQGVHTREVVITEDMLSSVRVGSLMSATSTLGTSLSDEQCYQLVRDYDEFTVWYDPDGAGKKGSAATARKLRLTGSVVRVIESSKDAKCYSNREMLSILQGATCKT
jgi:hypothetical protein